MNSLTVLNLPDQPAPSRECGGCTLCCKLVGIEELKLKPGTWCPHCTIGTGCTIYESRPKECASYRCMWLQRADIPNEYRPDRIKAVYSLPSATCPLPVVHLDLNTPNAWKHGPIRRLIDIMLVETDVLISCGPNSAKLSRSDRAMLQSL